MRLILFFVVSLEAARFKPQFDFSFGKRFKFLIIFVTIKLLVLFIRISRLSKQTFFTLFEASNQPVGGQKDHHELLSAPWLARNTDRLSQK